MVLITNNFNSDFIFLASDIIEIYKLFEIKYISKTLANVRGKINEYYKTITGKNNYAQEEEIIYRGNSDAKVFHQLYCPYYSSKNCTIIFRLRDEAVKKGYVPCTTCKP